MIDYNKLNGKIEIIDDKKIRWTISNNYSLMISDCNITLLNELFKEVINIQLDQDGLIDFVEKINDDKNVLIVIQPKFNESSYKFITKKEFDSTKSNYKNNLINKYYIISMTYHDYNNLPDVMNLEDLKYFWNKFFERAEISNDSLFNLEQLYQLIYRFSDYDFLFKKNIINEFFRGDIRLQLENYLKKCVDYENVEIMDIMLSIIAMVSLNELFDYIVSQKSIISNKKVLKLIDEFIKEKYFIR